MKRLRTYEFTMKKQTKKTARKSHKSPQRKTPKSEPSLEELLARAKKAQQEYQEAVQEYRALVNEHIQAKTFFIPADAANGLVDFLKNLVGMSPEDGVSAESVFPDLADPAKVIGMRFRAIRKKKSLTQEQVEAALNIDKTAVSKIENGTRPRKDTILEGTDPEDFDC